jgi:hypothetical protein
MLHWHGRLDALCGDPISFFGNSHACSLPACCVAQPQEAQQRGALQLLDSLDKRAGKGSSTAAPMPVGFLEEFAQRFEAEGLETIIGPIGRQTQRALLHALWDV